MRVTEKFEKEHSFGSQNMLNLDKRDKLLSKTEVQHKLYSKLKA